MEPNKEDKDHSLLDKMGAMVATIVMTVYAFTVVAPYVSVFNTNPAMLDIIQGNKSTVDLITTAVVMFYFGASMGRRKDQETMSTMAQTSAAAQAALPAVIVAEVKEELKK